VSCGSSPPILSSSHCRPAWARTGPKCAPETTGTNPADKPARDPFIDSRLSILKAVHPAHICVSGKNNSINSGPLTRASLPILVRPAPLAVAWKSRKPLDARFDIADLSGVAVSRNHRDMCFAATISSGGLFPGRSRKLSTTKSATSRPAEWTRVRSKRGNACRLKIRLNDASSDAPREKLRERRCTPGRLQRRVEFEVDPHRRMNRVLAAAALMDGMGAGIRWIGCRFAPAAANFVSARA